jgi:predicted dehydrogenase
MKPVRWGVISTAWIGTAWVLPGMMKSPQLKVAAIASRDGARARRAAKKLGIPKAYGSYEELLADPEIEAIYNPLPNHLHVPLTLAAARAGKHVLCEKPIAITAAEAALLRDVPKDILVAEAFMVRHHPQWQEVRKRAQAGAIGRVHTIQVFYSYYLDDPNNIRNMADIGGGGLLDVGVYPVVVSRFVFGAEPIRAVALIDRDPKFKTDRLASAILDFGEGRRLVFTCSTQSAPRQRAEIVGTKGRIEVEIPFNAPQGKSTRVLIDKGKKLY